MQDVSKASIPAGAAGYEQQQLASAWRAYLAWECSNPQKLSAPELAARVSLAYDQALMPLRLYPDVSPHSLTVPWLTWVLVLSLALSLALFLALLTLGLAIGSGLEPRSCEKARCEQEPGLNTTCSMQFALLFLHASSHAVPMLHAYRLGVVHCCHFPCAVNMHVRCFYVPG